MEIAAESGMSAATLHDWHRAYGGMATDVVKEFKEAARAEFGLKRLLAEAELEKDALRDLPAVWDRTFSRASTRGWTWVDRAV